MSEFRVHADHLSDTADSFIVAAERLLADVVWVETEEGNEYWLDVHESLLRLAQRAYDSTGELRKREARVKARTALHDYESVCVSVDGPSSRRQKLYTKIIQLLEQV